MEITDACVLIVAIICVTVIIVNWIDIKKPNVYKCSCDNKSIKSTKGGS